MTKFEENGCDRLLSTISEREAKRTFRNSCNICAIRNYDCTCDRCQIKATYENMIEIFKGERMPIVKPKIQLVRYVEVKSRRAPTRVIFRQSVLDRIQFDIIRES